MVATTERIVLFIAVSTLLLVVNAYDYEGSCGENVRWSLVGGTLTVSGKGEMTNYTSSYDVPWYEKCFQIQTIEVEEGVTSIGDYAFYLCNATLDVRISTTVRHIGSYAFGRCDALPVCSLPSGLQSIASNAFYLCKQLKTMTIPASVSSIGAGAFARCGVLSSIKVEKGNEYYTSDSGVLFNKQRTVLLQYPAGKASSSYVIPSSVTTIAAQAFRGNTYMRSVTIPDTITSIESLAFVGCTKLTHVVVPANVSLIGNGAFGNCNSLSTIDVQDGNKRFTSVDGVLFSMDGSALIQYPAGRNKTEYTIPEGVVTINNYAFYVCKQIQTVGMPDSVTSVGSYAFSECANLQNIVIPRNVESIGIGTFQYCTSLLSVLIGSNVKTIGKQAFSNCRALEKVFIPRSVNSLGDYAFYSCDNLAAIEVEHGNEYYKSVDGVLFNNDLSALIQYPSKKADSDYTIPVGVSSITRLAFQFSQYLTTVVFPDTVTSVGDGVFQYCYQLINVTLGNRITSIGNGTFYSCTKLKHVNIPKSVKTIGHSVFYKCSSLSAITISSGVKSIGYGVFTSCDQLSSINVEEENEYFSSVDGVLFDHEHTTIIRYPPKKPGVSYTVPYGVTLLDECCFKDCLELKRISLPDSVVVIRDRAFASSGLQEIDIPNSVKSIGYRSFAGCSSLQNVTIPDSVRIIGCSAFYGCSELKNVKLGSYVESIGMKAFYQCKTLTNITIPEDVKAIGTNAFQYCTNLESVFYQGSHVISSNAFSSCSALKLVCVPPDYNSSTFCGKIVNSSSELCGQFQRKFNHCYKGTYVDGEFIQEMRNNASEWERKANECMECHCDNESGRIGWSKCNNTENDDITLMCVEGQCVARDDIEEKNYWIIEVEIEETSIVEMSIVEVVNTMNEIAGADKVNVGYETDDNGYVVRIVLSIKDEESAKLVTEALERIDKEQCTLGVLCRTKRIHVHQPHYMLSCGNQTLKSVLLMLVFIVVVVTYTKDFSLSFHE